MSHYFSPTDFFQSEIEVKKSRFIVSTIPISTTAELLQLQEHLRLEHPRASHHCTAYIIGDPSQPESAGSSDDGEPSGTAGKPMLNILMHRRLGDVGVVVTRYFGGTKLGAGGLIRAYGSAVSDMSEKVPLKRCFATVQFQITYPYELEAEVGKLLVTHECEVIDAVYAEQVCKLLRVRLSGEDAFQWALKSLGYLGVQFNQCQK